FGIGQVTLVEPVPRLGLPRVVVNAQLGRRRLVVPAGDPTRRRVPGRHVSLRDVVRVLRTTVLIPGSPPMRSGWRAHRRPPRAVPAAGRGRRGPTSPVAGHRRAPALGGPTPPAAHMGCRRRRARPAAGPVLGAPPGRWPGR